MREIQGDPRTYTEEPDGLEDYKNWKSGFVFDDEGEDIEKLMEEERVVERIYLELVPLTVDKECFWSRYFYEVNKLKQAEESRVSIVKRAISGGDDDEDLTWDDDDDDIHCVPTENASTESTSECEIVNFSSTNVSPECETVEDNLERTTMNQEIECKNVNAESKVSGEKNDNYDSCKDSDVSIISTQPSLPGEEELGWDEIEYVGSDDGDKITMSSSSNISDLRKRLISADEEEDLSWDVEDEPIKS